MYDLAESFVTIDISIFSPLSLEFTSFEHTSCLNRAAIPTITGGLVSKRPLPAPLRTRFSEAAHPEFLLCHALIFRMSGQGALGSFEATLCIGQPVKHNLPQG